MDLRITVTGTSALLMHSARLANPLDPATKSFKRLTSKRKKTDDDFELIAQAEFIAGLYHADPEGPYMPADNINACLIDGAKMHRLGEAVKRSVVVTTDINPLIYRGPRDPAALYADENFRDLRTAKVSGRRTLRCRPMFRNWSFEADVTLDTEQIDLSDFENIMECAGSMVGLGDWRPRYGRFTATVEAA